MSSYPENKKVRTQHTTATFNQTADRLNAMEQCCENAEFLLFYWTN